VAVQNLHPTRRDADIQPPKATPTAGATGAVRRPKRRRLLMAALILLAVAGISAGTWWWLRPLAVTVGAVTRGEAVDAVYASGVVEYVRQARVAPAVTAPIRQVLVTEGQAVRKGQALAQLDDGPQQGVTLQLEAQAQLARANARRTDRLFRAGFAAAAAEEDAGNSLAAAEAAAGGARAHLADYRIAAPFPGKVLRRDAEPGDLATPGTPLFVIADTSALRVTADVDERDVGHLAVGQEAVLRADAFAGETFPARVAEITPQGDSTGRVFRARLHLDPATRLRPGMTVEANLVTARRSGAVLVPTAAIRDGAVWRVEDPAGQARARRQPIRIGAQGADRTEVLSGLAPGTRVVLAPPAGLKDGARISIRAGK
jgi:RND family efflux transporter MFP subunit